MTMSASWIVFNVAIIAAKTGEKMVSPALERPDG